MTSGDNNFSYSPNFLIFVAPEDFCDAFCIAGGAYGRPWRKRLGFSMTGKEKGAMAHTGPSLNPPVRRGLSSTSRSVS